MRMRRARTLCGLLAALGALAAGPAAGVAGASNGGATQAYVQANYSALRVAVAHLSASEAAPVHVLAQVRRECPGVGAGSPQDGESTQMSDEVIGAMVIAAYKPDVSAIRAFVRTAAGLRWSNGALTRSIRNYVADWKTLLSLPAPNLCGDVRAWAADGYRALPASTVSFVAKFMPAWVAAGFLPAQLRPYESAGVRAVADRSVPLEQRVSEAEARAVEHYGQIMNALMIWP